MLRFCATVSTMPLFPSWNFTKAGCKIGYARSGSFRNMDRSPGTGIHALRLSALTGFPLHAGVCTWGFFVVFIDNRRADPLVHRRRTIRVLPTFPLQSFPRNLCDFCSVGLATRVMFKTKPPENGLRGRVEQDTQSDVIRQDSGGSWDQCNLNCTVMLVVHCVGCPFK